MRRKTLSKLLSCVLLGLFGFSLNASAQTPDYSNSSLGTFTGGNNFPFNTTTSNQVEQINLAGEFVGATPGLITSVYYKRARATPALSYTGLKVEIGQTTTTSFAGATYLTGGFVARNSNWTMPVGAIDDWFEIELTTPVLYDPSKTIWINTSNSAFSGGTGPSVRTYTDCTPGRRRIYGAYGSPTGNGSDCSWYEMGIDLAPILGTDVMAFSLPKPNLKCGETSSPFSIELYNLGQDSVFDIPVTMEVTGTVGGSAYSQTFNALYTDTIKSFEKKEITFPNTINTFSGANLSLRAWVTAANDTTNDNDTIEDTRVIYAIPSAPTTSDLEVCGGQEIFLQSSAPGAGEGIVWTEESNGRGYLAEGDNTNAGFTTPNNYTYYAHTGSGFEKQRNAVNSDFTFYVTGVFSVPNGGMFQVEAETQSIIIDSIGFYAYTTANTDYEVYYKYDTYDGFETDQSKWKLLTKGTQNFTGGTAEFDYIELPKSVSVRRGDIASFYVSVTNNSVYLNTGARSVSDGITKIDAAPAIEGFFGANAVYTPYAMASWIGYRSYCESNLTSADIVVKPKPYGSEAIEGSPFTGFFLAGTKAQPDVMADGDEINYSYNPPAGFNNADFGSTWDILGFEAVTVNGTTVPASTYMFTNPSGTNNANVKFTPDVTWADSTIEFQMLIKNLDPNNLCDSLVTRTVFLAPRPEPDFDAVGKCAGDAVEFVNNSSIKSGNMRYVWDFGDGEMATVTSPIHVYDNPGTYNVVLEATNDWGYKETFNVSVSVKEKPDIKFRPINACEGTAVQFENNTTLSSGAPISYEWTFGDGSPKDLTESPSHLYVNSGEYSVTLTAVAEGCDAVLTKNAFQFPQPTADFEISNDECNVTSDVVFTNKSTISSGRLGGIWNFGDLTYSTDYNTTHSFGSAGTHDIELKIQSAFGCTDIITKQIVLKESPIASFDNTQTCDIDPVEFTNTSFEPTGSNVDYTWDFGDPTSGNNSSNLTNPEHKYSLPGSRKVTLKAIADNGCEDEVTKDIVIGVQPQAGFDVKLVCEGEEAVFVNKTTISRGDIDITYEWDFDDTETSTDVSPEKAFASPGVYTVTLIATATEGGCTDTETQDITVYETPDCDFSFETDGSGTRTYNYSITNKPLNGSTISWEFGDGGFSDDENPQWQYSFDGGFYITLRVTSPAGCDCETIKRVNVFKSSVGDIELSDNVSVYPNPSTGVFTVELTNVTAETTVSIFNALGQQVNTTMTVNADNKYAVDLSNQPAGIYTVKVQSGTSVYTTKITITK